jgi:membrane protein implicated in regulation of membrane protease activity
MIPWQAWWFWLVAGAVLGAAEILLPGFILLGFALGAALVGILLLLGVLNSHLPVLLLVFACASLGAWLALRQVVGVRRGQVKVWTSDINDN